MLIKVPRPAPPTNNLCEGCYKNILKYIRKNVYVCKYCWDRAQYESLRELTDEQLDEMYRSTLAKLQEKNSRRGFLNAGSMGIR